MSEVLNRVRDWLRRHAKDLIILLGIVGMSVVVRLASRVDHDRMLQRKRASRRADERRKPLDAYRAEELAEMSRDIFDDRHGFSAARHAFVAKQRPASTPTRIAWHRPAAPADVVGDAAARRAS